MEKKTIIWIGGIFLLLVALVSLGMVNVKYNRGFEAGYYQGYNESFNRGIEWTLNWTHENCVNYICGLGETNCEDEMVLWSSEDQCFDVIGGEK